LVDLKRQFLFAGNHDDRGGLQLRMADRP
jgi:hypothetical protein